MARIQFNHRRIAQLSKKQLREIYGGNDEAFSQALEIWQRAHSQHKKSKEEGAD